MNMKDWRHGFTLVELLVVVAIIAILFSMLLPALFYTRNQAVIAKCLAHQRQLLTAWTAYTSENNGDLVGGHNGGVYGWIYFPQDELGNLDYSTAENRFRGLKRGAFYTYVNDVVIYRCPAADNNFDGVNSGSYRTYMIAGGLNGEYNPLQKYEDIRSPSEKFVFIESVSPSGYDVGAWTISLPGGPFQGSWFNSLTILHQEKSVLGFVDGHLETHPWQDDRTIEMEYGFFKPTFHEQIDNPDYLYMQSHFPYDRNKFLRDFVN